jgi:acetyl-CoA carboxylase biotin carboxyl carrier protein
MTERGADPAPGDVHGSDESMEPGAGETAEPVIGDAGPAGLATGEILGLIDRLEDLLDRSDLAELEVQVGEFGLVLRRPTLFSPPSSSDSGAGVPPGSGPDLPAAPAALSDPVPHPRHHRVLAPLTGIWYLTPSPDASPYVKLGQEVVKGQVIGLIEAMKLFNEIKSDASGRVVSIFAETGALVKQKQPIIELEPA